MIDRVLDILFYFTASQILFFVYAIFALNCYRGWLTGKLTYKVPAFYIAVPGMVGFVIVDWLMNMSVFSILCWELPCSKIELVTGRMARYKANLDTTAHWRIWIAVTICSSLNLFNFDSTPHC